MISIISIILIGVGLSMDTFSLSIAYGSLGFSRNKTILISLIVGMYHFFMPLIGLVIGKKILDYLVIDHKYIIFLLFLIIGIQMLKSNGKDEITDKFNILGILLFGFSVSIDSFTTGIGLEYIYDNHLITVFLFMICSAIFTFIGLNFGKYLSTKLKDNSSMIGGIIFILLSLYYLFF